MKQVIMFNFEIQSFADFLMSLTAKGRESLARTRFVKILGEQSKLIEEERVKIVQRHAEKDEEGNPKTIQLENGTSQYKVVDMSRFNIEYAELMNQHFEIDCTPERKQMLESVRDMVLDCDMEFSGEEAMRFDRWCEILEVIDYND